MTSSPTAANPAAHPPAAILGQPNQLFVLFFTEMWERFSYYGMRALLVLFLITEAGKGGWGWSREQALDLYGWYTLFVYLTPILGGYIADRLLGTRRSVLLGGFVIAAALAFFDWRAPDAIGWFWLIFGGSLGGLAHICVIRALALAPASDLQPYNYLLVVFATLLGWLVYGDVPGQWTVIGATLICACGVYAMRRAAIKA